MNNLRLKTVSSLEKIFHSTDINALKEYKGTSAVRGDTISFQVVFDKKTIPLEDNPNAELKLNVESDLNVFVRQVMGVPVHLTTFSGKEDDNFVSKQPGLYPDLLTECGEYIVITPRQTKALWIEVTIPEHAAAEEHSISIEFANNDVSLKTEFKVDVIGLSLPKLDMYHTEWFHYDGLCHYYDVGMFSDRHLAIVKQFMETGVKRGINTIMIPTHTPPLDTQVGTYRQKAQLVDISLEGTEFTFNLDKLRQFIAMSIEAGFEYFEIPHLYSQWGAFSAPAIYARANGEDKRLFGWETKASSDEYKAFLTAYVSELTRLFKELGIERQVVFHISDEPSLEHLASYTSAAEFVKPMLEGYKIVDALSNIEFYKQYPSMTPVPGSDHIEPFLQEQMDSLWVYYCCCQDNGVSNRFMSMPSARNRILGIQLYKYEIEGFLGCSFKIIQTKVCKSDRA